MYARNPLGRMPVSSELEHAGMPNLGPYDPSPISISDTACSEDAEDIQHPLLLAGARSYGPFDSTSLRGAGAAPEPIRTVDDVAPTFVPGPIVRLPSTGPSSPFPYEHEHPGPSSRIPAIISWYVQRQQKLARRKARRGRAAILAYSARRERKQLCKAARCSSRPAIGQGTPPEAAQDKKGDLSMGPPKRRYARVEVRLGKDELKHCDCVAEHTQACATARQPGKKT
jgi:hypothetical protein